MFVVRTSGRSAAVDTDRHAFKLLGRRQFSGLDLARPVTRGVRSRALLELQQNYGRLQFRALVGGEFVPGEGDRIVWRVRCWETVRPTPQQGLLPGALLPGLPARLDDAAAMGLRANLNAGALPAGQLVIDRAGYNQESSPRCSQRPSNSWYTSCWRAPSDRPRSRSSDPGWPLAEFRMSLPRVDADAAGEGGVADALVDRADSGVGEAVSVDVAEGDGVSEVVTRLIDTGHPQGCPGRWPVPGRCGCRCCRRGRW